MSKYLDQFKQGLHRQVAGKTVYVGLSGGVDSSVSCGLLKEAGAEVVGVYMKNWAGEAGLQDDCPWKEEQEAAIAVCDHLGIEFLSFNFEQEYKERVLDYFFAEYKAGRTPNPDILCNSEIKFKAFLNRAIEEGADLIATGHYACLSEDEGSFLMNAKDTKKDQTYFLSDLTEEQLERVIFPLCNFTKSEVRDIARQLGLPNAERKDSQGICFVGDLEVQDFLRKYIDTKEGDIIDIDSQEVVGTHDGIMFYTIGQREGLQIGGTPEPYYVVKKHAQHNVIYVAMGNDNPHLYKREVKFSGLHWINEQTKNLSQEELNATGLTASIRYRQIPQKGLIYLENAEISRFVFEEKQRAISPGQSIVFYSGKRCLGRAVIEED